MGEKRRKDFFCFPFRYYHTDSQTKGRDQEQEHKIEICSSLLHFLGAIWRGWEGGPVLLLHV